MNEDILGFIWRFQYFMASDLQTDSGEKVNVRRAGHKNTNAGPDFSDARIEIDGVEWIGSVEIHVKSSDWYLHQHENDKAYETVVLHVVWENDAPVARQDGTLLPTIALKGLVRLSILERYRQLQDENEEIPCASLFRQIDGLQKMNMLDRTLLERLDTKASNVMSLLQQNNNDWEETAYQWLGQHFGYKLNDPAFLRLTQIVPRKIVLKHRHSLTQIEALLFGAAGFIPEKQEKDDAYMENLRREYHFLASKYGLHEQAMQLYEWKFLRLRPAGFPTIRLAQFCKLLSLQGGIFQFLTGTKKAQDLSELFHLQQSDYWTQHFQFGKKSKLKVPYMGKNAANSLIINAAVPLMVAYSKHIQKPELLDTAIEWLSVIPAENNRITRAWEKLEMTVKTAADSQALIEWYNNYCTLRRCLECTVGAALVRSV